MQPKGPYVAIACFCERVLQEQDGVLSAIRIVDQVKKREGTILPEESTHAINILIVLKAGDFDWTGELEIRANSPSGKVTKKGEAKFPVELKRGKACNFIINTGVPLSEDGTYWYDVLFDNRLLTRMPMSVSVLEPQNATPKPVASRPTLSQKKQAPRRREKAS